MKAIILEAGIVYNGSLMPWNVFYDIVTTLSKSKVAEKLKKEQKDRIKFDEITRDQNYDTEYNRDVAQALGIRKASKDLNRLKKQIDTRIKGFNETNRGADNSTSS